MAIAQTGFQTNGEPTINDLFADTGTCDVPPQEGDLGLPGAMLVVPGDSANSILAERMRRRDANGMPPLGSNLVDTAGVAVVENWIDGLSGCP